ncbi:MAG: hypothetical protein ABWZ25_18405 [Chitinophagaceae bacterium]
MRRVILPLLVFFCVQTGYGQSHGLEFSSHEVIPEKRTSLRLTSGDPICMDSNSEITFEFRFRPGLQTYFGYIMRLITDDKRNIDLIYNQRLRNFNFVIGETFSSVFEIDSATLFGSWNVFTVRFESRSSEVLIYVNKRFIGKGKINARDKTCYHAFFGTNDYEGFQTIDVPPMQLRDIAISENGKPKYFFSLSESAGQEAPDRVGQENGLVKNPVWIKPRFQNWQKVYSLETNGITSLAFDKKNEVLYIISPDSLFRFSFSNMNPASVAYSRKMDTLPWGTQSIFDPSAGRLYNFYIDEKKLATYDPVSASWDKNFTTIDLTTFWQANKFISPSDSSLYVLGGYGQLRYRNTVQRYHLPTGNWQMIEPGGDFFMPRYLAALGINAAADTAFILGGYGSSTGDQTINPRYNYDLVAYSVRSNKFKTIFHLKEPEKKFCFANSLVIGPDGNEYYALTYPKDRFNSSLQLIKGSLRSPVYELMGDSIPYLFYDVESFADLYYCPASNKLVAVALHTSQEKSSSIQVYTIDFPPNQLVPVKVHEGKTGVPVLYRVLMGMLVLVPVLVLIYKRRKTGRAAGSGHVTPETGPAVLQPVAAAGENPEDTKVYSAIHLFGRFEAIDKQGQDISTQFTPLLRELFLLVVLYSIRDSKGISQDKLYEILWHDKSTKDARNNYSVNIVKLKTILEKIGDVQISRESGKLALEIFNESVHIDLAEFYRLISPGETAAKLPKPVIVKLVNLLQRGSLLSEVHYSWLDNFKSETSGLVIDVLMDFVTRADLHQEAELVIRITNTVFKFDHLHEAALEYKCKSLIILGRHGLAKDAYLIFSKEYKENYGVGFEKTFPQITGQ